MTLLEQVSPILAWLLFLLNVMIQIVIFYSNQQG